MAAQKRPSAASYAARGSLIRGWLPLATSHGVPSALVTRGTPKNCLALTGHPGLTLPEVSSTSNDVLTPCRTSLGDAASAMSGGLQRGGKIVQVLFDPCIPMALVLSGGTELAFDVVVATVLSLVGASPALAG